MLALVTGSQEFGVTAPSRGPTDIPQGHLPIPIPSLHFTPSLSFISSSLGEDSQKKLPSARISCPKGSMAYASYCYALFITPKTWMDADVSAGIRS